MDVVQFAILGLATGALYAMVAQGLVVVYRGSGLLNFAQAAFVMVGAYAYFELHMRAGVPVVPSLLATIAICAALASLVHVGVLRPMRQSSPLARVIATLAVLIVLYSAAVLRYQHDLRSIPSLLPTQSVTVVPGVTLGLDRILIFVIGCVLTAIMWAVYRFTSFGRATTAVAEGELCAATVGHSPDRIATVNWAIGGSIAALAGVFIAPITYLEPNSLAIQLLIFPIAAALAAGFRSFPGTLAAALVIGVVQSWLSRYVHVTGIETAAPFVIIIVILVVRGRGLPLRSFLVDRLPAVGTGRIRPLVVGVLYVAVAVLGFFANTDWTTALTVTITMALICLSVVVITGYAGQLSLAQYVLAGVGALVAAHLSTQMPFIAAVLVAIAVNVVVGGLVGLPALRTRGITLAIVTLGLGVAVYAVVLSSASLAGGQSGIRVRTPSLFGWDIDPLFHGGRYTFVALTVLVALLLAVANLRRGVIGRRLIAIRSNERAAASLGLNVAALKSYAFMVGTGIAGLGGVLLAFLRPSVLASEFNVFDAINMIGVVVIGGVGSPIGALIGATLIAGGVTTQVFGGWEVVNLYLPLAGGVILLLNLRFAPDGIVELNRRALSPVLAKIDGWSGRFVRPRRTAPASRKATGTRVLARSLSVSGLSVAFGGVRAVTNVDIDVRPGEVHGLIGPNGAGKTTLIDAITGFVQASSGRVSLGDTVIGSWSARRRARAGLARSFQSLELFDDLTVAENLAVACQDATGWRYVGDLLHPKRQDLTPAAMEVMSDFGLEDVRDQTPDSISFGHRKQVAIARSVARSPSVLLLDEPAAGLDDRESADLAALIRKLADDWGIGILLVEHKVDMVMSVSDRITVLQGGSVLTFGSPREVREDPAVAEAYLGVAGDQMAGVVDDTL